MVDPILIGLGITAGIVAGGQVYSLYDPTKVVSIISRTEEGEFEQVIDIPRKRHGLIVLAGGRNNVRDDAAINTSDLVYKALRARGYERDNLYFLESVNRIRKKPDCHTLPSSKKHLMEVLEHLYKEVTADDVFFMYVLTHGRTTGRILPVGQSTFSLDEGTIREKELEEILSDLHPNYSLTYFNSCHSGGFAQRLGKKRNIAISTSKKTKVTTGYIGEDLTKKYGNYATTFSLHFFAALGGQFPDGSPLSHHFSSIAEIFDYAAQQEHNNLQCKMGNWFKNIPHLSYGKIDPREIKL